MCKLWLKIPGPGQFRGEGEWTDVTNEAKAWAEIQSTGYLPAFKGPRPPEMPANVPATGCDGSFDAGGEG